MAIKRLFLDDYLFRGKHEEMARQLISVIDSKSGAKVFNSAVELFMASALVGVHFDLKSKPDPGGQTLRIMASQFTSRGDDLDFIYKLVMLHAGRYDLEAIDRINNAFKFDSSTKEYQKNVDTFEEYMLGGLTEIYNSFMLSVNKRYDDYQNCLNSFISKFSTVQTLDEEDDLNFDDLEL